jgi:2-phospho-L-lactate transferase/gluconeogenesis factor (CofD/UPF0052 family)
MLPQLRTNSSETGKAGPDLRVVAIGGGTGLSTLLKGLKRYVTTPTLAGPGQPTIRELCGVVTVSDDGGSSGRLRKEFNMLAPGDVRNCIVALSEDEALLSRLFQHRFQKGSGLEGHSFGNLFLAALTSITGDFGEAVRLSSEILLTRELRLVPPDVEPLPQTLEAIAHADLITVGPGSLFTSLTPNLLVRGISEAILESPAVKVFVCNLMTQANESLSLTAADHIRALNNHAGVQFFDYALINRKVASPELKAKYALEGASQIVADIEAIEGLGVCPVLGDYLEEGTVARHATDQVAHDLMALMAQAPTRQTIRS